MKNEPAKDDVFEQEYTFRNALTRRQEDLRYLWQRKFRFLPVGVAGILLGLLLAWYWPITYTSRVTFVVDDSKGGSGSMLSSLAGQFGLDMGSLSTGGVLAGDNVLQLLKSQSLIKKTLLTPYKDENATYTLADKYAEVGKLKKSWTKYTKDGPLVSFPADRTKYTRLQDSLLQDIVIRVGESNFSISKPDKKLTFFEASANMKDEKLSQLFCTRLIKISTDFYVKTKTQKLRTNVERLQRRTDSIGYLLNRKTYSASASSRMLLDANPAFPTTEVSSELQSRDKMMLSTAYSEVYKNLEASKTMLMQETPTIEIVDVSEYPLKKNHLKYLKTSVLMAFFVLIAYAGFLLLVKELKK
ncbi:MAG: hypothetical protein V4721_00700 [Bacteroidota bacterium]